MRPFGRLGILFLLLSIPSSWPQVAAELVYGPYVQNVRADRATIVWLTHDSAPGRAMAWPATGGSRFEARSVVRELPAELAGLDRRLYQHRAELTSLSAGIKYVYQVLSASFDLAGDEEMQFRTAGSGPFTFLVVGDAGWGGLGQAQVAARMNEEGASLVLITGDVVYHGSTFEAYRSYYFPYYSYIMKRVPFFPSLGNHDYESDDGAPFLAVHVLPDEGVPAAGRGRFYSFDWGNVHFVCLDSLLSLTKAIHSDGAMLEWLDKDLGNSGTFWKVVYLHHPPFPTNNYTWDPTCAEVRERIVPILERHSVDVVFAGHEHNYQRTYLRRNGEFTDGGAGTTYVVTGGGGAPLYETRDNRILAARKTAYHYVRAEVTGARLRLVAIDEDGEQIDSIVLAPPPEINPGGVVDARTYTPSLKAGGYVTIFGHHLGAEEPGVKNSASPQEPGDVTVTLDGVQLPLLYVSPTQINARLPLSAVGKATLRVHSRNGAAEATATIRETP